jgi:tetratricopeptide (TPR) repeat protein
MTRTLAITKEINYQPGIAISYHQHGMLAQQRGQLDEAADWYQKALAVKEELGDQPERALTLSQLGLLASEQQRPADALEFAVRSVTLFDEFPHPATGTAPRDLASLTAQLGFDALERCWRNVTGSMPPQTVRDFISAQQPRLGTSGMG